jgi:hypothetical protein
MVLLPLSNVIAKILNIVLHPVSDRFSMGSDPGLFLKKKDFFNIKSGRFYSLLLFLKSGWKKKCLKFT